MGVSVNLDTNLVKAARAYSAVQSRSVPKQIEHWAKIGRISEENPDLSYSVIQDMLLGIEDAKNDDLEEYFLGSL
jgi:hypothetical protein